MNSLFIHQPLFAISTYPIYIHTDQFLFIARISLKICSCSTIWLIKARNSQTNMEACFVTSKPFSEKLFPLLGSRVSYSTRRRQFVSQFHQPKKVGNPFSVTCCQASSPLPSPSPQDEERPFTETDWRSFRARLVAGERASRSEDPSSVVNPDTVDDLPPPPAVTIGSKWAHTIHEPEKGCILIATEKLEGVHIFERTVVLLLSMGPIGPMGLILNRPSLMSIKEMRSSVLDMSGTFANRPLFFGGPLEDGLFLVSPNEGGEDGLGKSGVFDEVMKGLYYGTKESVGCASEMVKRDVVGVDNFRFFDGYCAWEKDQLRDEIKAGYWTVAACSPSVIGLSDVGSVGLWDEVLGLMTPKKVW